MEKGAKRGEDASRGKFSCPLRRNQKKGGAVTICLSRIIPMVRSSFHFYSPSSFARLSPFIPFPSYTRLPYLPPPSPSSSSPSALGRKKNLQKGGEEEKKGWKRGGLKKGGGGWVPREKG